jgi:hypothetical protein
MREFWIEMGSRQLPLLAVLLAYALSEQSVAGQNTSDEGKVVHLLAGVIAHVHVIGFVMVWCASVRLEI